MHCISKFINQKIITNCFVIETQDGDDFMPILALWGGKNLITKKPKNQYIINCLGFINKII